MTSHDGVAEHVQDPASPALGALEQVSDAQPGLSECMPESVEATGIPGPPVAWTDLLDAATTQRLEDERNTPSKYFPLRPSSAGHCAKKLAYDLAAYRGLRAPSQEVMEPNVDRLLKLGHSVEYSAIRNFEQIESVASLRYKQQVVSIFRLISTGELVEGSSDLVFWSEKWRGVADIKSAKDGWSAGYKSRWDEKLDQFASFKSVLKISDTGYFITNLLEFFLEAKDAFLADNIYQLNLYATSEFFTERGVDHASIIKYNKNDSRQYELRFSPSQELKETVRRKFDAIAQSVKDHGAEGPEHIQRDYTLGSMRCSFCPYAKECWDGQDVKKAFFATLGPKKWPTDIGRIKDSRGLSVLFSKYETSLPQVADLDTLEQDIIKLLVEKGISKLRLDNDHVYEVKMYKTGGVMNGPRAALKRAKA